ncbi:MAG: chemotaxis protein CheC [Alteromonadaceae bacterium]|jgi:chemotaxis protein CheC
MEFKLSELEIDALTEIFNIGVGRAADSLNKMVSKTIELSIPVVEILPNKEAKIKLNFSDSAKISAVKQKFVGDFNGQALLMFGQESGLNLVRMLLGRDIPIEVLSDLEEDSLVEIGNVILNACFGTVINFLKSKIEIEMPEFIQGSIDDIFTQVGEHEWSLYIRVKFSLPNENIEGHISFLMDIKSLVTFQKSVSQLVHNLTNT